jgi:carbon-monoxide dehydrogenase medium subunit
MKQLSPMRVSFPTTVGEASDELRTHGDDARVYAGGAELVLLMRIGAVQVDRLVDVKHLPGIRDLSWSDGVLEIGAAVTHRRLETDREVWRRLPMFADAESRIGNIRIRNQGTLGGNLAFNDPHSDPTPPLLVHDATVVLESTSAGRDSHSNTRARPFRGMGSGISPRGALSAPDAKRRRRGTRAGWRDHGGAYRRRLPGSTSNAPA